MLMSAPSWQQKKAKRRPSSDGRRFVFAEELKR
jgi:hypothetical protein